jgi:hypothetical protein
LFLVGDVVVQRVVQAGGDFGDFIAVDSEGAVRKNLRKRKPEKMRSGSKDQEKAKAGKEKPKNKHRSEDRQGHGRTLECPGRENCDSGQTGRRALGCVLRLNEDEGASGNLLIT